VDAKSGLRIEGLYQQMLELERHKHRERAAVDPRWTRQHPGEDAPPVYRRRDDPLRSLEAGVPVLAPRSAVRLAYWYLSGLKGDPFPWDLSVRTVRVSPDDVVRLAESAVHWPGCAAEDAEEAVR
jgi:broad specificity phosphatase PhoE